MTPIRTEIRTDYVGDYYAYVYSDGHVETDPPNRPLYKEDVQRLRRQELARTDALRQVAAEKMRVVEPGRARAREMLPLSGSADQLEQFRQTLTALRTTAGTNAASPATLEQLRLRADLGGELVGLERLALDPIGDPEVRDPAPASSPRSPVLEGMR